MPGELRRSTLDPAFVLHRRNYRDTSALVELLTRTHGRLGVVARGVRARRSRWAGLLQPFQPVTVSWQARGELGTLTDVEPGGQLPPLRALRLVSGFYANELLIRLLAREDAQPQLFESYARLIAGLAGPTSEGALLRVFERDLLAAIGYGLALTVDIEGAPVQADGWYRYDLERGPAPVAPATNGGGVFLAGATLLALAQGELADDHQREARRLMRVALNLYLGERPLKSRELYRQYRGIS